jgi:hypothetical protein
LALEKKREEKTGVDKYKKLENDEIDEDLRIIKTF